jgi:hypothetical protein
MANFTSNDLAFTGYSQTVMGIKLPTPIEIIDANYVNKTEEREVVHFCNQFLEKYKVPQTKASFQKAEFLLQHTLLEQQGNKDELLDWIASNWIKL